MIVPVSLGSRSYKISVGSDLLKNAGALLARFQPISSVVILTDTNVDHFHYAQQVGTSIVKTGILVHDFTIEQGEGEKTIGMANTIWEDLPRIGIDRKAVLVAVGGGVIGDLGGFIAATYARGIRFFQVPTTLLAQVDSSVGGKVGVNLTAAKNMVGAFHQPLGVLIDIKTLHTLPNEQYLSGLGEVMKYAMSLDAPLFRYIESNAEAINRRDNTVLQNIITKCCRIKAKIVAEDEYETTGQRILLNYGHTFAHAFEVMSDYTIPHGLAVSMGSVYATRLAVRCGFVDQTILQRQIDLHRALNLPVEYPSEFDEGRMIELMRHDKKSEFGKLRFVLPTRIGQCRAVEDVKQHNIFDTVEHR